MARRARSRPLEANTAFNDADAARFVASAKDLAPTVSRDLALLRCTRIAVASAQYRRDHQMLPATLDALVPLYLEAAPIDSFSGRPLRYTIEPDGATVSSSGPKQRDGSDLGVRIRAR